MSRLYRIAVLCALFFPILGESHLEECKRLETIFRASYDANDTDICSCDYASPDPTIDGITIGCSSSPMNKIHSTLTSLNSTIYPTKLLIRDSLVNILPADMFTKVKPRILAVERSRVSLIRNNSLGVIGDRLRTLSLRNNKIRKLEKTMFDGLGQLKKLDVSGNTMQSIDSDAFDGCASLEELLLNNNELSHIEDGTFSKLKSLKKLTINRNQLTVITRNTFKGLVSLEMLSIHENKIEYIDWAAFAFMKNLKYINVGTNKLTTVDLRGLDQLQKVFLNNNSINSLKSVTLKDLPALTLLSLDRNQLAYIGNNDFSGLKRSIRLSNLAIASNNITMVGPNAFEHVPTVEILSLQNNQITALSNNGTSFLAPLRSLQYLQLSANYITAVGKGDIPPHVKHLALDHNLIGEIDEAAFEGVPLKRIFLNNNKLKFLPTNSFNSFPPETIEAIDVSSNQWQCVCGSSEEWLPRWLDRAGDSDVSEGLLGCLAIPNCGQPDAVETSSETLKRPGWVTYLAFLLTIATFFIFLLIIFMAYKSRVEPCLPMKTRTESDCEKLIADDPMITTTDDAVFSIRKSDVPRDGAERKKVRFVD